MDFTKFFPFVLLVVGSGISFAYEPAIVSEPSLVGGRTIFAKPSKVFVLRDGGMTSEVLSKVDYAKAVTVSVDYMVKELKYEEYALINVAVCSYGEIEKGMWYMVVSMRGGKEDTVRLVLNKSLDVWPMVDEVLQR